MQKRRGKGFLWAGVVIGFFIALYLVESDTFGSAAVAVHNGGYGTFDMKSYDEKIVAQVLAQADAECREAYYRYYGMDFLFILFLICFTSNYDHITTIYPFHTEVHSKYHIL